MDYAIIHFLIWIFFAYILPGIVFSIIAFIVIMVPVAIINCAVFGNGC